MRGLRRRALREAPLLLVVEGRAGGGELTLGRRLLPLRGVEPSLELGAPPSRLVHLAAEHRALRLCLLSPPRVRRPLGLEGLARVRRLLTAPLVRRALGLVRLTQPRDLVGEAALLDDPRRELLLQPRARLDELLLLALEPRALRVRFGGRALRRLLGSAPLRLLHDQRLVRGGARGLGHDAPLLHAEPLHVRRLHEAASLLLRHPHKPPPLLLAVLSAGLPADALVPNRRERRLEDRLLRARRAELLRQLEALGVQLGALRLAHREARAESSDLVAQVSHLADELDLFLTQGLHLHVRRLLLLRRLGRRHRERGHCGGGLWLFTANLVWLCKMDCTCRIN